MKKFLKISLFLLFLSSSVFAGSAPTSTDVDSILLKKHFNFFAVLNNSEAVKLVSKSPELKKLTLNRTANIKSSSSACSDVSCYADLIRFSDKDIKQAGDVLVKLYSKKDFKRTVTELRKQSYYSKNDKLSDTAFLRKAWEEASLAVNHVIAVYVSGKKPRYPKIDSISFSAGDAKFKEEIRQAVFNLNGDSKASTFYQLPVSFALQALKINGRDEAARYEPMNAGMNKLPFEKVKTIIWGPYRYSAILIPGSGPGVPGVTLNDTGIKRCAMGAERYRAGLAPFIVVSGGHVHPFKTPVNEAVEMKNYMVEKLGIPSDAIFIEPHARHTTTNLRNTNRIVYRFGIPEDKPILIVTDESQSQYILRFGNKCLSELGYLPYRDLKKLSEVETVYFPTKESLHIDPLEPLDP